MLVPIRCAQAISCSRGRPRSRAMHPTPEVNPKLAHQFAASAASAACSGYESLAHLSRLLHKSQLMPLPRTKGKAQFKVCIRTRAIALYPHVCTRARSAHTARGRRHTRMRASHAHAGTEAGDEGRSEGVVPASHTAIAHDLYDLSTAHEP